MYTTAQCSLCVKRFTQSTTLLTFVVNYKGQDKITLLTYLQEV